MSRARQIVGLDIGSRNVRAVWMHVRERRPCAFRTEQLALPPDAQDPAAMIRSWIAKCGLTNAFCAIALPGASTVFQPGRIPHSDPRSPRQIAAMDIAAFNDMAGDQMTYDVAAFASPTDPGLRHSLMAMSRPASIDRALQLASQIGIRPSDLVPAPVALFNQLERFAGPHDAPSIYLDIGHQQTELAIGIPAGLLFARSVPIGGKAFTDAIVQTLGLTPLQAEVRKHAEGLNGREDTAAALTAVAERWLSQISSCLGVYRGAFSGPASVPGQIVLSGGGARLTGLREWVGTRLRLPALLSTDLPGVADDAACQKMAGAFDLAAGLAVTALESGAIYLSLLPPRLRDEIVFREKKPYWIAAAACGALALGAFTASGLHTLRRDDSALQREREELRKREKIDKHINEIRQRGAKYLAAAKPVADLLKNGPQAREALTWVANSVGTNDWITLFCDEASYTPQTPLRPPPQPAVTPRSLFALLGAPKPATAPAARTGAAAPFTAFIVEGYTTDPSLASVKEMIARLRTAERVVSVDLLGDERVLPPVGLDTQTSLTATPIFRRFVIRLEVNRL